MNEPPAYRTCFCQNCGSPVPDFSGKLKLIEIPAGTLNEALETKPDKHIHTDCASNWFEIAGDLPQFDRASLREHRKGLSDS